ncbi:MAG TPA: DPP IV N-terminal domain-containing protein, partial [Dyadobacter sp.]|nr:DPP IV N-terminal domain-containing protein [Dyadobacter sp.]
MTFFTQFRTTSAVGIATLLGLLSGAESVAQKSLPAYKPSQTELLASYKRMELSDSLSRGSVLRAGITPGWQADGQSFWYKNVLKDSLTEYIYIDAAAGKKTKLFDNQKVAQALSKAADSTFSDKKLMLQDIRLDAAQKTIFIQVKGKWFAYNTETNLAAKVEKPTVDKPRELGWTRQRSRWQRFRADSLSPDKKQKAFVKNGNIYLSTPDGKKSGQLTFDGNPLKPFGELSWSPDGKYLVCYRITPQEERQISIILSSLPNTTRGEVKTRGYAQPGDEFTSYEMFVIDVKTGKTVKVKSEAIDFFNAPVIRWRHN